MRSGDSRENMQMLKTLGRSTVVATVAIMITVGMGQQKRRFTVKGLKRDFLFEVSGFQVDENDDFGEVSGAGRRPSRGAAMLGSQVSNYAGEVDRMARLAAPLRLN